MTLENLELGYSCYGSGKGHMKKELGERARRPQLFLPAAAG